MYDLLGNQELDTGYKTVILLLFLLFKKQNYHVNLCTIREIAEQPFV